MGPQLAEHDDVLIDEQLPTPGGLRVVETAGPAEPLVATAVGRRRRNRLARDHPHPARLRRAVARADRRDGAVRHRPGGRVHRRRRLGALLMGAVRAHAPILALILALLLTAPLAGLLHWLESWLAHAMAYQLLAEMRIDLFRKLDALAPAYLLRRRSGDLVALATQDVETVEYFFAHTIAPAIVAVLVPAAVLVDRWRGSAWPLALVLAPFLIYAGASPVLGRRRIDALGSEARGALGSLGGFATETIQGLAELAAFDATGRRRAAFMAAGATAIRTQRLGLLADLTSQTAGLEVATGPGRAGRGRAGRAAGAAGLDSRRGCCRCWC